MTKEQLKEFNGKDGKPAYIGYKGKVYDVSKSDFWPAGEHMGRFKAGEDLTDSIDMSPHGEKNIFRFAEVDVLEDGTAQETNTETVVPNSENMLSDMDKKMIAKRQWYKKNHPHPKLIHFPIGMYGFAFFVQVLAAILGGASGSFLAATSLIATVFGTLFLIPAIASGALSFYIILGAGDTLASFLKYNPLTSLYSLFTIINMAVVTFIAANGGKITWPQDKK